jgi:hypothetical protein
MSNVDTTDVVLAGLGIGGFLWMNRKLGMERRARVAAEQQRDCARACAVRAPANGLKATAMPTSAPSGLAPRSFDSVFAAYGQGLPVTYLRALALRESNMTPRASSGPAVGLLQVIDVVREDYNQRTGAKYSRQDLTDPAINVAIAASALSTIAHSYAQNHPRVPNLQPNWSNPRFVELLTFGWNAGWSERGGVGRVSKYLEQRGVLDQSIDVIHQTSRAAGASPHLANAAKVAWSKSVAAQYLRELTDDQRHQPQLIEMPDDYVGRPTLVAMTPTTAAHLVPVSGPITSPSQVSASGPITSPSQVNVVGAPSVPAVPAVATPSSPTFAVAGQPSGLMGPINPYDDCGCPA